MVELKKQYDEKQAQKEELKRRAEHTELMLDRASKLVSGLAGERIRWQETVKVIIKKKSITQTALYIKYIIIHCVFSACMHRKGSNKLICVGQC